MPERAMRMQVRCFVEDNQDRWLMWYSGRAKGQNGLDAVFPGAGSIGRPFSLRGRDLKDNATCPCQRLQCRSSTVAVP